MKIIFATILIAVAVMAGVAAMGLSTPIVGSAQMQRHIFAYGAIMYVAGAATIALVFIGAGMINDALDAAKGPKPEKKKEVGEPA